MRLPRLLRRLFPRRVPVLVLVDNHRMVRRWPFDGRILEAMAREGTAYEVNEFGDWMMIGRQASEMASARLHHTTLLIRLRDAEDLAAALRKDLATLLTHYPGCDVSGKPEILP